MWFLRNRENRRLPRLSIRILIWFFLILPCRIWTVLKRISAWRIILWIFLLFSWRRPDMRMTCSAQSGWGRLTTWKNLSSLRNFCAELHWGSVKNENKGTNKLTSSSGRYCHPVRHYADSCYNSYVMGTMDGSHYYHWQFPRVDSPHREIRTGNLLWKFMRWPFDGRVLFLQCT